MLGAILLIAAFWVRGLTARRLLPRQRRYISNGLRSRYQSHG
jgi:hypothetical protein